MEFGEELFWVALLVIYFFFQVLGGRKKKQQQQNRRPADAGRQGTPETPQRETELDEALHEIRRALGFPEEPKPEPTAAEPPPPRKAVPEARPPRTTAPEAPSRTRIPEPVRREAPRPIQRPALQSSGRIPPPAKAFKREEAFEKMGALPPVGAAPLTPVREKTASRRTDLIKRLYSPAGAREAFLMKEILGPRRGKRRS